MFDRIEIRKQNNKWIEYDTVFNNVPEKYKVNELTPHNTRLIIAKYPDNYKCFLKKFFRKGDVSFKTKYGEEIFHTVDGVAVLNESDETIGYFSLDSVAIHPGKDINYTKIKKELKHAKVDPVESNVDEEPKRKRGRPKKHI